MSTATGEKTMELENQSMQDSREGDSGCDGYELAAVRAELMSLNICAICWGNPHSAPCGFCGTVVKPTISSRVGAIWVLSWNVSQQQSKHPCRSCVGPEEVSQGHTEGGGDGGWTGNYQWQPDAKTVWGKMTLRMSRANWGPKVWSAAVNHLFLVTG